MSLFKNSVMIALLTATKAVSTAQLLELPPSNIHQQLVKQFGDAKGFLAMKSLSRRRNVKQTATDCPGTPFLWKIVETDSGKHVGFGLGTMHLPPGLVLTEEAYISIINAVEDSCNIYGEINLLDPTVTAEIQECMAPLEENAATVADIPDDDVRAAFEAKVMEVVTMGPDDDALVDSLYQALLQLPLFVVEQFIVYSNTPEYEEYLLQTFAGMPPEALDVALLSLGRVAGGVEEVSTQCDVLKGLYPTPEELDVSSLLLVLNQTLSDQITSYKCGDIENFIALQESLYSSTFEENSEFEDIILDDRNEQMAAAIAEILETSDERVLFAFGNAHWLLGDKSLTILLNDYGYSLEYVQAYGKDDAEDLSNERCGVRFNAENGVFELIEANSTNSHVQKNSTSNALGSSAPTPNLSQSSGTSPVSSDKSDMPPQNSSSTYKAWVSSFLFAMSYIFLSNW